MFDDLDQTLRNLLVHRFRDVSRERVNGRQALEEAENA